VHTHIADSLAGLEVEELARAERIGDLGAGAGFPGLVLAAALPNARVDLVESARRKVEVIARLAAGAALTNIHPVALRAEEWAAGDGREAYAAVTARAVGPLALLVEYAAPLLRSGAVLVAWKGRRDREEDAAGSIAADAVGLALSRVVPVKPYEASRHRHLYVYSKVRQTPDRFPRRPGTAAKRPLA
jgi:16S rRNA (guanine527-N7)-methyltransferase